VPKHPLGTGPTPTDIKQKMNLPDIQFGSVTTVALCILMLAAVVTDMREHRIPNLLVIAVLLLGLMTQIGTDSVTGIVSWAGGLAIGMAIFLPFYIGGGMGAGDVKLMAATAGFLGPTAGAIASGGALLAGLPLAVIFILARSLQSRNFATTAATPTTAATLNEHMEPSSLVLAAQARIITEAQVGKTKRIPYAAAIATGAMIGLWQSGQFAQLAGALTL
jgi:prepilin peptidase CpaA